MPDAASDAVTISALTMPASAKHTFKQYGDNEKYALYELDINFDNRFILDSPAFTGLGCERAGAKLPLNW
ncbi:hypothetical protein CWS02_00510 [Enterobacter sp. EA-1]|nr:hypothetical protein CWS02_00510 [Enterobacter sp. EA-1]